MTDFLLSLLAQSPLMKFVYAYVAFNVLWMVRLTLGFIFLAKLRDRVGEDSWWFKAPAYVFAVGDWIFNWEMSLLFWKRYKNYWIPDLPAVWNEVITYRMKRYIAEGSGLKYRFALIVKKILNKFDPGHI